MQAITQMLEFTRHADMDALEFARKLVVKFVRLWRFLCEFAVVRETLAPFGTN
jgi:hypothetical protein